MHLNVRDRGNIIPGAHRMQRLLNNADLLFSCPVILVTGTNGKGTVCAILESIFRSCGMRTGLYTSPHLIDINERIRVNGIPIDQNKFIELQNKIEILQQNNLPDASLFEILTAMAFTCFEDSAVDIAIVEIGLGGLFDSTNAFSPVISVITSIGIDHTEFLGSREYDISFDKAFISRRNKDLIVGKISEEALLGVAAAVEITGANIYFADEIVAQEIEELLIKFPSNKRSWLLYNRDNICTAVAAFRRWQENSNKYYSLDLIAKGVAAVTWPGRFDYRNVGRTRFLFDVAHNVQGVQKLVTWLTSDGFVGKSLTLVYASFSDKKWMEILPLLLPFARNIIITKINSDRSISPEMIFSGLPWLEKENVTVLPNLQQALEHAISISAAGNVVLVTGSVALVGEAMELLSLSPYA